MLRKLIIISSILLLSGCSYVYGDKGIIKNRDTDYLKAETTPALRIPPGLSSSTIQTHYPVSTRSYPNPGPISLQPPELAPKPVKSSEVKPAIIVPAPLASTENGSAKPPAKQRYLVDAVAHPEYITESFYPNNKPKTVSEAVVTSKKPVQQAINAPSEKKKRYIADYFR